MITPFDAPPADAEWRTFPLNRHYEISEYGHVRHAATRHHQCVKWALLAPTTRRDKYAQYRLTGASGRKHYTAHRLVALTFIPNPENFLEVAHNDGVPANCHISNLRWATRRQNMHDRYRHDAYSHKLTPEKVWAIRQATGPTSAVAEAFEIDKSMVRKIRAGESWPCALTPVPAHILAARTALPKVPA